MSKFSLLALIGLTLLAFSCISCKKAEKQDVPKATATAPAPSQEPLPEPTDEIKEKCALFVPPWGDGDFREWYLSNEAKAEEWFTTTEEKMKTADLSVIPKCTHLENMLVAFSTISDLTPFGGLTRLKKLDFRFSENVKDISPLKNLINLEYLSVWGTKVEDISPVAALPKLKEIDAKMASISDLTPLKQSKSLVKIDLLKNPVKDISPLAEIETFAEALICTTQVTDLSPLFPIADRITALDVCNTPIADLEQIRKFKNITFLRLWGLPIDDLSLLKEMKGLEDVDLTETKVKDLSPLHEFKNLKKLTIFNPTIEQAQFDALKQALPGIEIITKME